MDKKESKIRTEPETMGRRDFIKKGCEIAAGTMFVGLLPFKSAGAVSGHEKYPRLEGHPDYNWEDHLYAYVIDTRKCIGCGMCVQACRKENNVPEGFFRTWVERYEFSEEDAIKVDSPHGGENGFASDTPGFKASKGYFVPKMCNHCANTPCTQVCPVGASYKTREGVILVDNKRCVGCGYCVQACPFGSRFLNPVTKTAEKCTWCYHRLTRGMKPACVQACPVGARMFGDVKQEDDPVRKILALERVQVLQPEKLTKPSCFYIGLDKGVR